MGEGLICQLDWWLQLNPQWQRKNVFPTDGSAWKEGAVINCCLLEEEMEFCSVIRLRGINTAWAHADNKHLFPAKATVQENLLAIHCQWVYKGYLTCFRIQLTARTNTVFRMTIVPFWKKKTQQQWSHHASQWDTSAHQWHSRRWIHTAKI